jgi:ankyrin repeat protein
MCAVEQILAAGADVNDANARDGITVLMWASTKGHSGIVPLLLSARAECTLTGF